MAPETYLNSPLPRRPMEEAVLPSPVYPRRRPRVMTPKVCSRCRQDCSDRPRIRDRRGKYTCLVCLEKTGEAPAQPAAVAPAEPPAAAASPQPAPAHAMETELVPLAPEGETTEHPVSSDQAAAFEITAQDAADTIPLEITDRPAAATTTAPCPSCARLLAAGAAACTFCGWSKSAAAPRPAPRKAPQPETTETGSGRRVLKIALGLAWAGLTAWGCWAIWPGNIAAVTLLPLGVVLSWLFAADAF